MPLQAKRPSEKLSIKYIYLNRTKYIYLNNILNNMKKNYNFILLITLLIVLIGCETNSTPVYTINPTPEIISNFVGETIPFQVDYSVKNGKITSPQLISNCVSIEIQSQSSDSDEEGHGKIIAALLIKSYYQQSNCIIFKSNEHEQGLLVSIIPTRQAYIGSIDFLKEISYDQLSKFTANLVITERDIPQKVRLVLSSSTPNLKFTEKSVDPPVNINSGIIEFTTGEYQNSATPYGYIYLPNTGFPSVDLQPISLNLYIEKNGMWYLLDQTYLNGIKAS